MIHYTRKKLYDITKKLYYLIRHSDDGIQFVKLGRGVAGYYYCGTDEIEIDYRRDIIPTLIHESLHKWHPDWPHRDIYRHESRIVNSLSRRQIHNIIKAIGENL